MCCPAGGNYQGATLAAALPPLATSLPLRLAAAVEAPSALWVLPVLCPLPALLEWHCQGGCFVIRGLPRHATEQEQGDCRRLAAGAMAGVTEAVCIVTPFEVVKIRLQQQKGLDKASQKYKVLRCVLLPWLAAVLPVNCSGAASAVCAQVAPWIAVASPV